MSRYIYIPSYIKQLVVGDKVIISKHWVRSTEDFSVEEITRVTETQITAGGKRFNKSNQKEHGSSSSYSTWTISPWSQEKENELRKRAADWAREKAEEEQTKREEYDAERMEAGIQMDVELYMKRVGWLVKTRNRASEALAKYEQSLSELSEQKVSLERAQFVADRYQELSKNIEQMTTKRDLYTDVIDRMREATQAWFDGRTVTINGTVATSAEEVVVGIYEQTMNDIARRALARYGCGDRMDYYRSLANDIQLYGHVSSFNFSVEVEAWEETPAA